MEAVYLDVVEQALDFVMHWIADHPPHGIGLIEWQFGGGAREAALKAFRQMRERGEQDETETLDPG
jgi:hypothetical protein